MMKILFACLFVIIFVGSINAQEDVDNCFCDVASTERVACPAGFNLTAEECLNNHCCHNNDDANAPACYERKASCGDDRCKVFPTNRSPCGSWQLGKTHCDLMNCCYDHRIFPYCYYSKDNATAKSVVGVFEKYNVTIENGDDVIIDVNVEPIGPNATHFNPETSHLVKVECNSHEKRAPCGSALITREKCLELSCCWGSSPNGSTCFHPTTKPVDGEDEYMNELGKLFEEYITIGDDIVEPAFEEFAEVDYGKFSVVIECLDTPVAGVSKTLCPANNRKRCLDISCCWNGTDCLLPVSSFSNNTEEIDIPNVKGPHGSTTDPDFWNPVFVNIHESVENRKLTCDHTMAALSCGFPGINRTSCLEKGCCWMPQFAVKGRYDMLCSLPVLTDENPMEASEPRSDRRSDWGPWETWSDCYVTEPCSNRSERMRWRTCESEVYQSGCKLQEEQVQIVPCFKPTACTDTHWSEWSSWSECSLSCGGFGVQERQRECVKGDTLENNSLCEDVHAAFENLVADKEMKECLRGICPK